MAVAGHKNIGRIVAQKVDLVVAGHVILAELFGGLQADARVGCRKARFCEMSPDRVAERNRKKVCSARVARIRRAEDAGEIHESARCELRSADLERERRLFRLVFLGRRIRGRRSCGDVMDLRTAATEVRQDVRNVAGW